MEKKTGECQTPHACGCTSTDTNDKENTMHSSTRDKVAGAFHEAKGALKEVAGKLTDNPKLQAEGTVEKIAGKVQEKVGQVKQVFGK